MNPNKQIAIELFERFTRSDIPGVLDLMTDDATWLIPGKTELSPSAGLYDKRKIGKLFNIMLGRLKSGLKMTVKSAIAEGDIRDRSRVRGRPHQRHPLPPALPLPHRIPRRQDPRSARVPRHPARARRVVRPGELNWGRNGGTVRT